MKLRSFDEEMPNVKLFTCTCPHCGHERLAVDNGRPIQARFTASAMDDTLIQCVNCGSTFTRKEGMRPVDTFALAYEVLERSA